LWTAPPTGYQPAPTPTAPSTFQRTLRDDLYTYDIVGNPKTITDRRTAADWPAGAKPVSRAMTYDDLYRVTQVNYTYPTASDTFTSPFASEQAGLSEPRQSSNFARHLVLASRVKQQTYKYDWLGSLTNADDDLHAMWDRGVGPVANFASTGMPYRWKNAGDSALSTWVGAGAADALAYDEAGNLLDFQIARTGACTGGGTDCSLRFTYAYDELGRLNTAQRKEGATLKADFRFTYDYSDDRILKSDNTVAQKVYTVYPLASLELRRTTYDTTTGNYAATAVNETPFLSANGVRLGRVTYEGSADGEPRLSNDRRHVLLEVGDHLGSTSVVIDKATGELAERITFQAYGATESDYRPDRWKGFREDYRFTGKEEDIEVGLTYFGKRFLSAPLGRWVSPDPLAVHMPGQADLNLYAYVHGAVLKATDPSGLQDASTEADRGLPPPTDDSGKSLVPNGDAIIGEVTVGKSDERYTPTVAGGDEAGIAVLKLLGTQAAGAAKGAVGTGMLGSAGLVCPLCLAGATVYGLYKTPEIVKDALSDPNKFAGFSGEVGGGAALGGVMSEAAKLGSMALAYPKVNPAIETRLPTLAEGLEVADALAWELQGQYAPMRGGFGTKPPVVVGAFDTASSEAGAFASRAGAHAEVVAKEAMPNAMLSKPISVRANRSAGGYADVCVSCEARFGRALFPPGTTFKSDF
jgi:RHS repeat-associated protein